MRFTLKKLLKQINDEGTYPKDLHIVRFYSSYIAISNGKIINVTDPHMAYCPLASSFYRDLTSSTNSDQLKQAIMKALSSKISRFGHFTHRRKLFGKDIAVPYGASEILMYALRKKIIDAAVVVCDGAGTVIVNKPELVQGIGARMNGLFYTTPIQGVARRLKEAGSHVVFDNGGIDQIKGVEKAALLGYKNIAVTINASMDESLSKLRKIGKVYKLSLTSLAICTTGIDKDRIREIEKYADIVWSCASEDIRTVIGKKAILQFSRKIPVFVLTKKGLDLISKYSSKEGLIKSLDLKKQYVIVGDYNGKKMKMGNFDAWLNEAKLPVRHKKEPVLNAVRS